MPRRRLELLHLAATASKTVMSTIPSPGHIYWIYQLPSCTPLECRPTSWRLVLGSMAPYGRTSTIPLPGQIHWIYQLFILKLLNWCSRWDLNPHTHRAYASETYVSTIPPPEHFSTNLHVLYVYPFRMSHRFTDARSLGYGSLSQIPTVHTSTIPPPEQVERV